MAGPFQQTISQPSAVARPTTAVADTSSAELLTKVGGMAIEAHKGYQEAGLEKDINAEINDYIAGQMELAKTSSTELGISQAAGEAAEVGAKAGVDDPAFIKATEEINRKATLLTRAAKDTSEVKARVDALTKKYVSKMPGYTKELMGVAKEALGMRSELGVFEAAEKSQQEAKDEWMKAMTEKAKSLNVTEFFTNPNNPAAWVPAVQSAIEKERTYNLAVQGNAMGVFNDRNLVKTDDWDRAVDGGISNFQSILTGVTKLPSNTLEERQRNAAVFATQVAAARRDLAKLTSMDPNSPKVKAAEASITQLEEVYGKFISGEFKETDYTREINTANLERESKLLGIPEYENAVVFRKVFGNIPPPPEMMKGLVDIITGKKQSITNEDVETLSMDMDSFKGAAKRVSVSKDATNDDMNFLKRYVTYLSSAVPTDDSSKAVGIYKKYVNLLADPDIGKAIRAATGDDALSRDKIASRLQTLAESGSREAFHKHYNPSTMSYTIDADGLLRVSNKAGDAKTAESVRLINESTAPFITNLFKAQQNVLGEPDDVYRANLESYIKPIVVDIEESAKKEEERKKKLKEATERLGGYGPL